MMNNKDYLYPSAKGVVSVIVLSYNSGTYLYETIESVLQQDYCGIELIVSDDGSKEFSVKDIETFIKNRKKDDRFTYRIIHREKNIGTVRNINRALSISTGEYIKMIGGDDTYPASDIFSRQIAVLEQEKTMAVVGKTQQCDSTMKPIRDARVEKSNNALPIVLGMDYTEARKYIAKKDIFPIANQAVCYRREFFLNGGFCDEDYVLIEDVSLANRLLKMNNQVSYLDEYTVNHRAKVGISTSRELFAPRRLLYYQDCITYAKKDVNAHPEIFGYTYRKQQLRLSEFVYSMAKAKANHCSKFDLIRIMGRHIDTMIYYILTNTRKFLRRMKERVIG